MKVSVRRKISRGLRRHHRRSRIKRTLKAHTKAILFFLVVIATMNILASLITVETSYVGAAYTEPTVQYEEPEVYEVKDDQDMYLLIYEYAEKHNVDFEVMYAVVACENREFKPELQSYIKYNKDYPEWGVKRGQREESYGLAQIHLPSHPNITKEQAQDAEFALEFMAENLAKGKGSMWSCYRKLFN